MKNVRTASLLIVSFLLGLFTVSLMIGCSSDSGDDVGNNAPAVDGGHDADGHDHGEGEDHDHDGEDHGYRLGDLPLRVRPSGSVGTNSRWGRGAGDGSGGIISWPPPATIPSRPGIHEPHNI